MFNEYHLQREDQDFEIGGYFRDAGIGTTGLVAIGQQSQRRLTQETACKCRAKGQSAKADDSHVKV